MRIKLYIFWACLICFQNIAAGQYFYSTPDLNSELKGKKISLILADIEITKISEKTDKNTSADWTTKAQLNMNSSLENLLNTSYYKYEKYKMSLESLRSELLQLVSLQQLVNKSILANFQSPLPSNENPDWSIGADTKLFKKSTNADYGLFIFFRAGFNGITGVKDYQSGIASLVDFNTGRTVWFSAKSSLDGDLRDPLKSVITIFELFDSLPGINGDFKQN